MIENFRDIYHSYSSDYNYISKKNESYDSHFLL